MAVRDTTRKDMDMTSNAAKQPQPHPSASKQAVGHLLGVLREEQQLICKSFVFTYDSRNRILAAIELVKKELERVNAAALRELSTLIEIATVAVFKTQRHSNRAGFERMLGVATHLQALVHRGLHPETPDQETQELMDSLWSWLEANH